MHYQSKSQITHLLLVLLALMTALLPATTIAEPGRYGYDKCINFRLTAEEIAKIKADLNSLPHDNQTKIKSTISVPVYVHIIQDSGNNNPVTQDQINAQIDLLNSAYSRADFSFFLAGTETVVNDTWGVKLEPASNEANEMVASLRQGGADTLNIYLTDLGGGLLGYASFPWDYQNFPDTDGIVVLSTSLPGGESFPYDQGKTVVHETGHWLGLFHTFQPSSSAGNGCKGSGDWVTDTPAEKIPHYACRRTDSCKQKGADPIHNFMSYTTDACQTKFTKGQLSLIQDMWSFYRAP